jgi:hypothetical protein
MGEISGVAVYGRHGQLLASSSVPPRICLGFQCGNDKDMRCGSVFFLKMLGVTGSSYLAIYKWEMLLYNQKFIFYPSMLWRQAYLPLSYYFFKINLNKNKNKEK